MFSITFKMNSENGTLNLKNAVLQYCLNTLKYETNIIIIIILLIIYMYIFRVDIMEIYKLLKINC